MNKILQPVFLFTLSVASLLIVSCSNRTSQGTTTDSVVTSDHTVVPKAADTVVIAADDSLKTMLMDATKDFPGVTAATDQGVVTLTGNITRDKLPKLMMAVNALHPKKVVNNLTIQ